jgi:protein-tyrosine phosphatase
VHLFKLIVDVAPNKGPPFFVQPLASPLTVYLYVKSKYKLPKIKDLNNDSPYCSISYLVQGLLAPLPLFVSLNSISFELRINPSEVEHVGFHHFHITLEDDHKYPLKKVYPFVIEVLRYTPK